MDKEDIYKWILKDELKLQDLQHAIGTRRLNKILEILERGRNGK